MQQGVRFHAGNSRVNSEKELLRTSKFLSLVLRHQPEVIGLQLDEEGWLDIDALVAASNNRGKPLTLELVHEVIATNDKRRFALSDDGLRIRASQGHSVAGIDLNLSEASPPDVLYHGTVAAFIERIRSGGLQKRSRNHVHLSADQPTASKVGSRRGVPIILHVAASQMQNDGHSFFLSANGVY